MNRLILLVESRIRGDVYVRFGGELPKTHRSNTAGRWMLSLPTFIIPFIAFVILADECTDLS